jgi:hypothetical protein
MKGAHGHFTAGLLPDQARDSGAQLRCGLVRERDRQDLPWPDPFDTDQVGNPMRQNARFAAARPGQDEHRPVGGPDGSLLFGIQPSQYPRGEGIRLRLPLCEGNRFRLERRRLARLYTRAVERFRWGIVRQRRLVVERRRLDGAGG